MAGALIDTGGGKGRRRGVDSDLNMVPMIDLMMVTISFLLITAVWVRMSRIDANAQVPGDSAPPCETAECAPKRTLHVEMRNPEVFALYWTEGSREVRRTVIPRKDVVQTVQNARFVQYPGLTDAVKKEWSEMGTHRAPTDRELDRLVLHTDDTSSYANIIGAMNAIGGVTRPMLARGANAPSPAFYVTFATR